MAKMIHSIFFISLLLVSMAAVCTAQLPGMPERDASPDVVSNAPNDVNTGYSFDSGVGSSTKGHPPMGPGALQPSNAPLASTGTIMPYSEKGQALPIRDLSAAFSSAPQSFDSEKYESQGTQYDTSFTMFPQKMCPKYWAFYNGAWTQSPSAVSLNKQMNIIVYNDQNQNIWAYELYPNGLSKWYNWGYRYPGFFNKAFFGDMRGWHLDAVYGSQSGWSNVLWVYVW